MRARHLSRTGDAGGSGVLSTPPSASSSRSRPPAYTATTKIESLPYRTIFSVIELIRGTASVCNPSALCLLLQQLYHIYHRDNGVYRLRLILSPPLPRLSRGCTSTPFAVFSCRTVPTFCSRNFRTGSAFCALFRSVQSVREYNLHTYPSERDATPFVSRRPEQAPDERSCLRIPARPLERSQGRSSKASGCQEPKVCNKVLYEKVLYE